MWRVLRRRDFALVWVGGLISLAGDWVLAIGLPLYVYDRTGSTLATGAMVLARLLPQVLLGSLAGVFVDRWDRRRTLLVANLLLAAALVPAMVGATLAMLWLVYAAAFLTAALQQFVRPAEEALLPRLVGEVDLVPANALNALNNNLARLGGPVLGAVLYAGLGIGGVAIVDALSFLVAALCVALVRTDARPRGLAAPSQTGAATGRWRATWQEWRAGLRLARERRVVAVLLGFAALAGFGEGTLSALFVPFVRTVLDGGDLAYGLLFTAQAVGGLLGGVLVGRLGQRLPPVWLWGGGALGLALIDGLIFAYPLVLPGVELAVALFIVVGVPVAGLQIGVATIRQTAVSDGYRGRLVGTYLAVSALAMAVGTMTAGALAGPLGVMPLLWVQVVSYGIAGLLVLRLLAPQRRSSDRLVPRPAPASRESP